MSVADAVNISPRRALGAMIEITGDGVHRTVPLANPSSVGSGHRCEIRISDFKLPPQICTLFHQGFGWFVRVQTRDMTVCVNSQPVIESALRPGDEIQIGKWKLQLLTLDCHAVPPRELVLHQFSEITKLLEEADRDIAVKEQIEAPILRVDAESSTSPEIDPKALALCQNILRRLHRDEEKLRAEQATLEVQLAQFRERTKRYERRFARERKQLEDQQKKLEALARSQTEEEKSLAEQRTELRSKRDRLADEQKQLERAWRNLHFSKLRSSADRAEMARSANSTSEAPAGDGIEWKQASVNDLPPNIRGIGLLAGNSFPFDRLPTQAHPADFEEKRAELDLGLRKLEGLRSRIRLEQLDWEREHKRRHDELDRLRTRLLTERTLVEQEREKLHEVLVHETQELRSTKEQVEQERALLEAYRQRLEADQSSILAERELVLFERLQLEQRAQQQTPADESLKTLVRHYKRSHQLQRARQEESIRALKRALADRLRVINDREIELEIKERQLEPHRLAQTEMSAQLESLKQQLADARFEKARLERQTEHEARRRDQYIRELLSQVENLAGLLVSPDDSIVGISRAEAA